MSTAKRTREEVFREFTEDCEPQGHLSGEFFRSNSWRRGLREEYILVDFPRLNAPAGTRRRKTNRASRAYLVSYAADELINWSYDEYGHYQWVVLRTQSLRKEKIEDSYGQANALDLLRQRKLPCLRTGRSGTGAKEM